MDVTTNALFLVAFICALAFLFQSMFVLHAYETKNKKRPPSIQWWPFNREMKAAYPEQARVGRVLVIVTLLCALPALVTWAQARA